MGTLICQKCQGELSGYVRSEQVIWVKCPCGHNDYPCGHAVYSAGLETWTCNECGYDENEIAAMN